MIRNPLTDPHPGDVVRTPGGTVRVVYRRTPDLVAWAIVYPDGTPADGHLPLPGWASYNEASTVLYTAPEPA